MFYHFWKRLKGTYFCLETQTWLRCGLKGFAHGTIGILRWAIRDIFTSPGSRFNLFSNLGEELEGFSRSVVPDSREIGITRSLDQSRHGECRHCSDNYESGECEGAISD